MLESIGPQLYSAAGDLFLPARLVHFSLRMAVVQRTDGSVLLHSPVEIDDALAREIAAVGPVRDLVAPNGLHHLLLAAAGDRYPEARIHGPPAVRSKLRNLDLDFELGTEEADRALSSDLVARRIEGAPMLDEFVFLHRASRSLICTDLVFNVHETKGPLTPWLLRAAGTYGRFAQSRMWRFFVKDRAAAARSLRRILDDFEFDRILMAHGEIYEAPDVKADLERALSWLLDPPAAA